MRQLSRSLLAFTLVVCFVSPLAAQKNQTPVIASAVADGATLFIQGSGFGTSPSVSLGGFFLGGVIVNSLGTQIQAGLPAMEPGAYALVVTNGNNKATFEITIGAQGPEGPAGATGATGPQGLPGADGLPGPAGPTGPQGVMGINGANGATGPTGPVGPQGSSGILALQAFSGPVSTEVLTSADYSFLGPTATVTTTGSQRLTGAATAALGKSAAGNITTAIGLCYQNSVTLGTIINFVGGNYVQVSFPGPSVNQPYSATASVIPGAGTYLVGLCARGTLTLDSNDYVNGYVFVSQ